MDFEVQEDYRMFDGHQMVVTHQSRSLACPMTLGVYVPPGKGPFPAITYLSGLTCTWENATTKAAYQQAAAKHRVIIVTPDTSPRGEDVPDHDGFGVGHGAGFYVNAIQDPWKQNYRMYDYITADITVLLKQMDINADITRQGITGHSMGGCGALNIALKNPSQYKSVSAFAPICAPTQSTWGQKAFGEYLGEKESLWQNFDPCALIAKRGWQRDILVDQGTHDAYLEDQLKPQLLEAACEQANVDLVMRQQNEYDHSYYFIATFMPDHIHWHAERLGA